MVASLVDIRHPLYSAASMDWQKWRLTYNGGEEFLRHYLEKFTAREGDVDFLRRKKITPVPAFAKAALHDVRNAIFQRMPDISRRGGSQNYQNAVNGLDGGVDLKGSTMNFFLGNKVLTDLLVMGRVGVYVDMPQVHGPSLADAAGKKPYLYHYPIENILSWRLSRAGEKSQFESVLLKDTIEALDDSTLLPSGEVVRYRFLRINPVTKKVDCTFFDEKGERQDEVELELTKIPLVLLDIGDSLLKDVCNYQIALLNLVSSDISYALTANFPFYTEQADIRQMGAHLKNAATEDGTATSGGQAAADKDVKIGPTQGRLYAPNTDRPGFIHPSPEPLLASIRLQEKLETDIRKLINLAVQTLATRESAESKSLDNQGLEAGLSFIGLVMENGERQIAEHFASYESNRTVAEVSYPSRYNLKTDAERIEEATKLSNLVTKVPGRRVKKELFKALTTNLLGGKVKVATLNEALEEIENAEFTTSDPETILEALKEGACGERIAAIALGFPEGEHINARKDRVERAKEIAEAQAAAKPDSGGLANPAARGVPELDPNRNSGREERDAASSKDGRMSRRDRTRGKARRATSE